MDGGPPKRAQSKDYNHPHLKDFREAQQFPGFPSRKLVPAWGFSFQIRLCPFLWTITTQQQQAQPHPVCSSKTLSQPACTVSLWPPYLDQKWCGLFNDYIERKQTTSVQVCAERRGQLPGHWSPMPFMMSRCPWSLRRLPAMPLLKYLASTSWLGPLWSLPLPGACPSFLLPALPGLQSHQTFRVSRDLWKCLQQFRGS